MTDAEIQYIPQVKKFDCCAVCLEIAKEAAYSDGFKEDSDDDPVEVLESDTFVSDPWSVASRIVEEDDD